MWTGADRTINTGIEKCYRQPQKAAKKPAYPFSTASGKMINNTREDA
jgi:hypothetical protein